MNYNYNILQPVPRLGLVPLRVLSHNRTSTCCVCGGSQCISARFSSLSAGYVMKRGIESESDAASKKTFWANGLLSTMKDPKCIVKEDDKIVIIGDKYPKAEYHYLILPKEDISDICKLNCDHIPLLELMEAAGLELSQQHPDKKFLLGYHAVASMVRLHLHVISDDFNSICLKTKKHWNSFTTSFFISSQDLIETIKKDGKMKKISHSEAKQLMDTPLKCHKCGMNPPNMPKLKQHLLVHLLKQKHAARK